jgi:NAD(P)H-dependent flavin oxidoreductase YrpB (nitropropane dioxygenase family)
MWPRTDFLELLGITRPIVPAPMSGFTTPGLAAAVCNAGGLGSIGYATLPEFRPHVSFHFRGPGRGTDARVAGARAGRRAE